MFFSRKKDIRYYRILQKYKIDIEKTNQLYMGNYNPGKYESEREYCELVAESEDYNFYRYRTTTEGERGYILRQSKQKPKEVVYFGKNKTFNVVFHGYLFQVNAFETSGFGTSEEMVITARKISDGSLTHFNWISNKYVRDNSGLPHANSQDTVKKVWVQRDKLFFDVSRKKSGEITYDKYDVDANYKLEVEYDDLRFKASALFTFI